jgi:hypothetical protein
MPKITFKCEHCGEKHIIYTRDDYDGARLYTVCPITNRGILIER